MPTLNALHSKYGCDVPGCTSPSALIVTLNFCDDSAAFQTGWLDKYGASSVCIARNKGGAELYKALDNSGQQQPFYLINTDKSVQKWQYPGDTPGYGAFDGILSGMGCREHIHQGTGTKFPLSLTAGSGGKITASPSAQQYDSGMVVTLTAVPEKGYTFAGWGGDTSGTANPLRVTVKKARTISAQFAETAADSAHLVIDRKTLAIVSVTSEEIESESNGAVNMLDGDPATFWHTKWTADQFPHSVVINCGIVRALSGIEYTPRQNGDNGRIKGYEIYVSKDGIFWGTAVKTGEFRAGTETEQVLFPAVEGQYVKLTALSSINGSDFAGAAELNILYDAKFGSEPTYALTVTGGTGGGSFKAGEKAEITAVVPAKKKFVKWSCSKAGVLTDSLSLKTVITVPAQAVAVTALFADEVSAAVRTAAVNSFHLSGSKLCFGELIQSGSLQVCGFNGRTAAEQRVHGESFDLGSLNLSSGAYLVRIIKNNAVSQAIRFTVK